MCISFLGTITVLSSSFSFSLRQFCNEYAVPKDMLENFKEVTAQDIVCSQVLGQNLHI